MLKKSASAEDRCLVYLVCLVCLVMLVEGNYPDEPDKPFTKRTNFLSILREYSPFRPYLGAIEGLTYKISFHSTYWIE